MRSPLLLLLLPLLLCGCPATGARSGAATPVALVVPLAAPQAGPAEGERPAAAETVDALLERLAPLLEGHTDRDEEAQVIVLLKDVPAATLSGAIERVDLAGLIGDVDDRITGPDNRTALLDLLTVERLADLSTAARAALVTALQVGFTDGQGEQAMGRLLLGTRGAELTALKNAIDGGADHHDLEQLISSDIDDDDLSRRLRHHFAREADGLGRPEVKVLSDIDDTLYRNWVDPRYPAKAVYPGIRALHHELDIGPGEQAARTGDLVFVTARPGDRPGLVEDQTHDMLKSFGLTCAVLTGNIGAVFTNEGIAAGKFANFERYRPLFPEYRFVFTGDSGQGDHLFGASLMATHSDVVELVIIHDVVATSEVDRAAWLTKGCTFVDTYVGGAIAALEKRLISPAGAARVARAARAEVDAMVFTPPLVKAPRVAEIDRDIARLDALLPPDLRVGPRPGPAPPGQ